MAYAIVTAGCFVIVKLGRMAVCAYLAPLVFGNTGDLGLPLALFAFENEGLGYAFVG
jgi:predicted permease